MSEIRIRIQCASEQNHAKILRVDAAKGLAYMKDLAELVCGTSPMYIHPPGDASPIFRCTICGGKLTAVFEELTAPEIWRFDSYLLRATTVNDLALATEWTKADIAHAHLRPEFWLEQGPMRQSYLLFEEDGPILFFKGVVVGRVLEVFIQFPPGAEDKRKAIQRAHVAKALLAGTEWLAERMRGVVDEFAFETLSVSLKKFCEKWLRFEEREGKMRKRIPGTVRN